LTTFPPDVRTGALRPRLEVTPPRVSSAGSEAVDLCRSAGFFLDEWQQWVLEQALGERDDGKWSALEVGLLVPRQNGKGAVLMARMLAGLFLFEEELVIYSAHLYSTSSETFLRIKSLVENSDHLRKRCKKPRTSEVLGSDEGRGPGVLR
jgi:phage terminase large subunit-like protein